VLRCGFVSQKFHARFTARGKVYRYRIWSDKVLLPLERGRVWHLIAPLDFAAMKSAAVKFLGRHDFAGFAANRGDKGADTIRTIRSIKIRRRGPLITIECEGDGFLYKMVRLMVGAIVEVGNGKLSVQQVSDRLRGHGNPRSRLVAPAGGLFLVRVRY
jgi:tRNA pseudouridine38-40 synthase